MGAQPSGKIFSCLTFYASVFCYCYSLHSFSGFPLNFSLCFVTLTYFFSDLFYIAITCIFVFAIAVVVHGKPLPSGNNNQTCSRKQIIKDLCNNTKQDMEALFRMVWNKTVSFMNYTSTPFTPTQLEIKKIETQHFTNRTQHRVDTTQYFYQPNN